MFVETQDIILKTIAFGIVNLVVPKMSVVFNTIRTASAVHVIAHTTKCYRTNLGYQVASDSSLPSQHQNTSHSRHVAVSEF
jgi:hypothetical protein